MEATRRDLLKTAVLTLSATSAGIGIGGFAHGAAEPPETGLHTAGARTARDAWGRAVGREDFEREADAIYARHWHQTPEVVAALRRKYARPVVGRMRIWDAVQQLAFCIDRADTTLYCANQLIHVKQVVAAMEADGVEDPDMIAAAFTHDLGKILLLHGEAPENVLCANRPIGEHAPGAGLDRVLFQWNHDEFVYSRLAGHVPDHVAWLVHYHSIDLPRTLPLMDARDRRYVERYLLPFRRYDLDSKSAFSLPPAGTLARYRDLIEAYFPRPILI
jgi:hypothetical protein